MTSGFLQNCLQKLKQLLFLQITPTDCLRARSSSRSGVHTNRLPVAMLYRMHCMPLYIFAVLTRRSRCVSPRPQRLRSQLQVIAISGTSRRSARIIDSPPNTKHNIVHVGASQVNFIVICSQLGRGRGCNMSAGSFGRLTQLQLLRI